MKSKPATLALLVGLCALLAPDAALASDGAMLQDGYLWAYLSLFGAGFLVSLTPCVYPMIPIVLGVFGARDEDVSRRKAFVLATMYVMGMCTLYTALGVAFGLAGKEADFGKFLSNPWVVIPLVAFYLALAASMFGFFEFDLPQSVKNRLNSVGGKGYAGAFGMGLVGGLTAAPCTGPALLSILVFISTTGSGVLGGSLLFVHALGMGILFWVIAIFAVKLPKSGAWMDVVKSVSGVMILAVAGYFLSYIVPALRYADAKLSFLVGSLIVALVGLVIGAVTKSFFKSKLEASRKTFGVACMVVGLLGAWNWFLTPDLKLVWRHDEQVAFADANSEGKGVMIDIWANWCVPCKELEARTFSDDAVNQRIVENYVPLKLDVSEDSDFSDMVNDRYDSGTLPTVIFLEADGTELARLRGKFIGPGEFLKLMDKAKQARSRSASRAP